MTQFSFLGRTIKMCENVYGGRKIITFLVGKIFFLLSSVIGPYIKIPPHLTF